MAGQGNSNSVNCHLWFRGVFPVSLKAVAASWLPERLFLREMEQHSCESGAEVGSPWLHWGCGCVCIFLKEQDFLDTRSCHLQTEMVLLLLFHSGCFDFFFCLNAPGRPSDTTLHRSDAVGFS